MKSSVWALIQNLHPNFKKSRSRSSGRANALYWAVSPTLDSFFLKVLSVSTVFLFNCVLNLRGVSFIKFQVYDSYFFFLQYQKVKLLQPIQQHFHFKHSIFHFYGFCLPFVFHFHPSSINIFPPPNPGAFLASLFANLSSAHVRSVCLHWLLAGLTISFFLSFSFSFHGGNWVLHCWMHFVCLDGWFGFATPLMSAFGRQSSR